MVDLYTKFVLTIIAVALVWLCLTSGAQLATAQSQTGGLQAVVIAGFATGGGITPIIPVAISDVRTNRLLPISIREVGTAQALPVSIDGIGPRNGTVPVTISGIESQEGPVPVTIESVRTDNGALVVTEVAPSPTPGPTQ